MLVIDVAVVVDVDLAVEVRVAAVGVHDQDVGGTDELAAPDRAGAGPKFFAWPAVAMAIVVKLPLAAVVSDVVMPGPFQWPWFLPDAIRPLKPV
jgi:hypothetical protein